MVLPVPDGVSVTSVTSLTVILVFSALFIRIFYNLYLHPLAKFPGPWYAASFSLCGAVISVLQVEPRWLLSLTKKYGTSTPIRIAPTMLLFPQPSALKDIYWDPKCNLKSGLYGTGALGPPHLFTTLDGGAHKALRKALGGPHWTTGSLKNNWEPRIDTLVNLFIHQMRTGFAETKTPVVLSDKVAEFAADIMTMLSFSEPWGFVRNGRDERGMLRSWRQGLPFFGFVGRFRWFREVVMKSRLAVHFLPTMSDESGMGFLMSQADREVTQREQRIENEGFAQEKPDFLQHCLEASPPLSPIQKRAHVTLLIQAGADTTGTALGSTLRFLLTHASTLARARAEIDNADKAQQLSDPIQFEETRTKLPFVVACVKESLRLHPPATNLFARVIPREGKVVAVEEAGGAKGGGKSVFVPGGTEVTSNAYVVQRDPKLYAPDPETFRPERWLEASPARAAEMEAASFAFGVGPRVCLGREVAVMELWKLVPEIVRCFDFELVEEGRYVVAGGVAYNQDFEVRLTERDGKF